MAPRPPSTPRTPPAPTPARRWLLAALLVGAMALAGGGRAAAAGAHHHFTAGLKATYAAGLGHGPTLHQGGGGPFFEAGVIAGWLELELGVRLMGNEHGALLPISLLAKLPVELHPRVLGFVGLGPVLVPAFGGGETALHFALETVAGAYFSVSADSPWAVLVEGGYSMLREHGATVHEVASSLGLAYRF